MVCWRFAGKKQQEPSRIYVEHDNDGIIKSRRRLGQMLQELVIKVPAPFLGSTDIGFSTRYPAQPAQDPLTDVPFFLTGPPDSRRRVHSRSERALAASGPTGRDVW